jgi:hypothetical protein
VLIVVLVSESQVLFESVIMLGSINVNSVWYSLSTRKKWWK